MGNIYSESMYLMEMNILFPKVKKLAIRICEIVISICKIQDKLVEINANIINQLKS